MICNPQRGFVALISVLMFSGLLLLLAAAADAAAYLAHEATVDELSYRQAQQAALSCGRLALSRLYADPLRFDGVGTTTIQLTDSVACDIAAASSTTNTASALVQGNSQNSSVRIFITGDRASSTLPFHLLTWTEY